MSKLYSVTIATKDMGRYAKPEASIEAALLNGMVEASAWAVRVFGENIAWTEITDRVVKGHLVDTNERVAVYWSDLPMIAEDEITEWVAA